jgi:hypothetical protein
MVRQLRDDAGLSTAALRIGLLILDRIRKKDSEKTGTRAGQARISQQAIAEILGIDARTVGRAILSLKEREHFDVRGTPWRGGRAHCNVYTLRLRGDAQGRFDFEEAPETPVKMPGFAAEKTPVKMPEFSPEQNTETPGKIVDKPRSKCPVSPSDSVCSERTDTEKSKERESRNGHAGLSLPEDDNSRPLSEGAIVPGSSPTQEMIDYAIREIGSEEIVWEQWDALVDYCLRKGEKVRDPNATWRWWIRQYKRLAAEKRPQTGVASFAMGAAKHLNRHN